MRQSTGRRFLKIIPETKRPWIEARIRARVMVGATIWTDGHQSYKWLGKSGSGYKWSFVTHRHGEFSRLEYPNLITTNGVESLFGRVKTFCRQGKIQHVGGGYGLIFREFLWRERHLSRLALGHPAWRVHAFWAMADQIGARYCARMQTKLGGFLMPVDADCIVFFENI